MYHGPDLRVAHPGEVEHILSQLHEGSGGCQWGGRALHLRAQTQGYWWPKMYASAKAYTKTCFQCQRHAPIPHQPTLPLQPVTSPWPFAQWGMDLIGEMPKAPSGFTHIITATDYFTKWTEAEALVTITAADVKRFIWRNIISRFGVPYAIVSDNGTQFIAKAVATLCKEHGIRMFHSSVSYPQSNGQAEAANKAVSQGLRKRLEGKKGKWAEELPQVLWGMRTTPRRGTGRTPFSMAYGMEAILPLGTQLPNARTTAFDVLTNDELICAALDEAEDLRDEARIKLAAYQQELAKGYDGSVRPKAFNIDDIVFKLVVEKKKKKKLFENWEGPYRIRGKAGYGSYLLAEMNGTPVSNPWNSQKLRKYHGRV